MKFIIIACVTLLGLSQAKAECNGTGYTSGGSAQGDCSAGGECNGTVSGGSASVNGNCNGGETFHVFVTLPTTSVFGTCNNGFLNASADTGGYVPVYGSCSNGASFSGQAMVENIQLQDVSCSNSYFGGSPASSYVSVSGSCGDE